MGSFWMKMVFNYTLGQYYLANLINIYNENIICYFSVVVVSCRHGIKK